MKIINYSTDDIVAVVLQYFRPDITLRCVESLAVAGVKHILVWDNSTDAGASRLELGRTLKNDSLLAYRVTISGNGKNLGFSAGVNSAIAQIASIENLRYVLLINNDATINQSGVATLLESLVSSPKYAIAAPKFLNTDKQEPSMRFYNTYLAGLSEKKYFGGFSFLSGCCLLLDLEKVGTPVLDESFFMYGEDVALSLKLRRKGFELVVAESAGVEHIGASSSIVGSAFYEYHVVRGHILLTSRIGTSLAHTAIIWPSRFASLLARSIVRSLQSRSITPIVAFWRALFGLGVK